MGGRRRASVGWTHDEEESGPPVDDDAITSPSGAGVGFDLSGSVGVVSRSLRRYSWAAVVKVGLLVTASAISRWRI
eukprot:scaffold71305_cov46-Prasinocladus_malaysianus.AAC.1